MSGFSSKVGCGVALLALAGCGAPSAPAAARAAKPLPPIEQLNRMVERYWDEVKPDANVIAPQLLADALSVERRYLAELLGISRDGLDAPSQLSYDIFRRWREIGIEAATFPNELLPLNPFGGMTQQIAAQAEELTQHPAANALEYENWLKRIDAYLRWTQQATANMREGMRRGYTSPRSVIERMLAILERFGVDDSSNAFYGPLRSMPGSIKDPERARLSTDLSRAISGKLLPANRALHDFLQNEYLPRARTGIALSELPLGRQWYAFLVKRATSSALSPDEISRIGTAEVERLGSALPREAAAPASAPAGELLNAYKELQAQVQTALPAAFSEMPKSELEIRSADWLPQSTGPLCYRRSGPAGPAVLLVNTGKGTKTLSIADFMQRGLPGEHLQIALQQEQADLPRFRRFGSEAAFTEGWGLYAVSLGEPLNLYGDESAKSAAVAAEMRCAVGLVVDTGLHTKGWTRARAYDYLRAHLGVDDLDAQSLIDAYAASPAAALACVGAMRFRALRARAQQLLGARFELREFHSEVLRGGAMPLDILEAKMKGWMDAAK